MEFKVLFFDEVYVVVVEVCVDCGCGFFVMVVVCLGNFVFGVIVVIGM